MNEDLNVKMTMEYPADLNPDHNEYDSNVHTVLISDLINLFQGQYFLNVRVTISISYFFSHFLFHKSNNFKNSIVCFLIS